MELNPANGSNLEQLALKALRNSVKSSNVTLHLHVIDM